MKQKYIQNNFIPCIANIHFKVFNVFFILKNNKE